MMITTPRTALFFLLLHRPFSDLEDKILHDIKLINELGRSEDQRAAIVHLQGFGFAEIGGGESERLGNRWGRDTGRVKSRCF